MEAGGARHPHPMHPNLSILSRELPSKHKKTNQPADLKGRKLESKEAVPEKEKKSIENGIFPSFLVCKRRPDVLANFGFIGADSLLCNTQLRPRRRRSALVIPKASRR